MVWLPTVVIGLLAALVGGLLARRLGLSPIVGYLCAGMAVGPHTPGFVGDVALAGQLADVGVILLMFGVGLGFSPRDLAAVRSIAVPGALTASGVAVGLGALVALGAGWGGAGSALVFGLCLATASTVVIVRGLIELDLLGSSAGRIAVGWSVVEDLVTVVVLVLLPTLGGAADGQPLGPALLATGGKVLALAAVVVAGGSLLVPRLLEVVARARSRELFTLAVLAVALGIAFVSADVFGVSLALGAFLGGMVVGQSDLAHQAAADALPLRDAFAVLFFVAVGMLFDPAFVLERPGLVVACLGVVLVAKPLAALAVLTLRGYPLRTSLSVAAGVAQVSEFSFVLAGLALSLGILPEGALSAVLAAALISIVASPLLFRGAAPLERWLSRRPAIARRVERRAGRLAELAPAEAAGLVGHAVLCGHGRVGSVLAGFLARREVPFVVIEQDRVLVEELRARGVPALYGDAGSPTLLDRARVQAARALVLTTPDVVTARLALEHARSVQPGIEAVVRVHGESERDAVQRFPRVRGVHGEQELGFAMARLMLQRFGLSAIEAEAAVIDARRSQGGPAPARTRVVEVHVPADSPVIGRTVSQLELPRGVLVVTIAREGEFVLPTDDVELAADDSILILSDVERAMRIGRIVAGRAPEESAAPPSADPGTAPRDPAGAAVPPTTPSRE